MITINASITRRRHLSGGCAGCFVPKMVLIGINSYALA